jgi:predicted DNA-binding antitoxin AbrB/MazE fold protein
MQTITATFEDGVLKPAQPLNLPAHAEVRVTIELLPASPLTVGTLDAFLRSLPAFGDDAEGFSQDVRAVRALAARVGAELVGEDDTAYEQ